MSSTPTAGGRLRLRRPAEGGSNLDGMGDASPRTNPTLLGEMTMEALGSGIIAIFGTGVVASVVTAKIGDHNAIAWAWGLGVTFGIYVAAKTTGAHLNPAVTLAVTLFKGFPRNRVLPYIVAQVIGWFLGALIIRLVYAGPIGAIDPNLTHATQGIFSTSPGNGANALHVSVGLAFFDQIVGTAVLLFLIFAITDPRGANPSPALTAIAVGLVVVGIGFALGTDAGYAINPARDFGPRLMEWISGYKGAWVDQNGYPYFWVPIIGPLVGGVVGGGLYQLTVHRTLPDD
jgi:glycerol uptake facilitator protein